ncbi:MAG: dTDP-4-amino-4,6-dideoxygalactose transaminase [Alphaproteobacteria bacterium]
MTYRIPFNKPFIVGKELYYVAEAVLGGQISGDGPFARRCQRLMEERFRARKVFLTTSCTSALEMAALLCEIGPGDEVILPSYTFVSTANAFFLRGAKLVFVDIRPDTLNLDETLLDAAVTERTKAIVPVHYAGVACEMDRIGEIAREYGLYVIEDAAHAVNATYKGTFLGTIGDFGAYSFHETKNFICGEGGALLANTDGFEERAEIIREKGTNRSQFFRGQVDKYTWVGAGSSYVPADILAAFLYAQLENMETITDKRKWIYETYLNLFRPLADRCPLRLPVIPEECGSNYHMFYVILEDQATRTALIEHLKAKGILAVFHYVPLHTSPVGTAMGYRPGMFPVTEDVSDRLLRLPFYYGLEEEDIRTVADEVSAFFGRS